MSRMIALFVSWVFNPLMVLTYMMALLLVANSYLFGFTPQQEKASLLSLFFTSVLLPSLAVLLLKALGFVEHFDLRKRQDRIIPFIVCGIFYLWVWLSISRDNHMPLAMSIFSFGTLLALTVSFVINLYFKISLHGLGMGGLIGMVAISMWLFTGSHFDLAIGARVWEVSMNLVLMAVVLLAGITGWSRLELKAHSVIELIAGYALGLLAQFVALKILF